MTDEQIRHTLTRVRALVEALLGPHAQRIDCEGPRYEPAVAHPDLDDLLDANLVLDVADLDARVDRLLREQPQPSGERRGVSEATG